MERVYDFGGYATRNNLRCSDGRTIMKDAFKECDGRKVPLVWFHQRGTPYDVLGHAILENRNDGVYAYCSFNATDSGKQAKELVDHGDITALSIYANQLKQQGGNVMHGQIREVSLVYAGANPGASIQEVIRHGDEVSDDEAVIYTGENFSLYHASDDDQAKENGEGAKEICFCKTVPLKAVMLLLNCNVVQILMAAIIAARGTACIFLARTPRIASRVLRWTIFTLAHTPTPTRITLVHT